MQQLEAVAVRLPLAVVLHVLLASCAAGVASWCAVRDTDAILCRITRIRQRLPSPSCRTQTHCLMMNEHNVAIVGSTSAGGRSFANVLFHGVRAALRLTGTFQGQDCSFTDSASRISEGCV